MDKKIQERKCVKNKLKQQIQSAMIIAGIGSLIQIFPKIVQTIFAENCVAVVFIVAIILNLVLPKNMDVHEAPKTEDAE